MQMKNRLACVVLPLAMMVHSTSVDAEPHEPKPWSWATVINNGDYMPSEQCQLAAPDPATCRRFNSYNQPSINLDRQVVIRARSRGQQGVGQPVHGIYTRDMANGGPIERILDRGTLVPEPNNRDSTFIEPPSFPRIDIGSSMLATRGNHPPVWKVLNDAGEIVEQVGTSGIYTTPFGELITGASKLGSVADFAMPFQVPELPGKPFDVFPGAPAVADGNIIVFKGNYTDENLVPRTGVYYRELTNEPVAYPGGIPLSPSGGPAQVVLIANNRDSFIPGTSTLFGSTAPPSAAGRQAVFVGVDNEAQPTMGGIYLAPLEGPQPKLRRLVAIGERVPGEKRARFNRLGEGLSFDGRFVAFWGAWGTETKTLRLQCPNEGNAARRAFCRELYPTGFVVEVPVHQGIFVHDIKEKKTRALATSPLDFDDFVYWNFSGRVPGTGETGEEDDGEPARWRYSAFVAVSGMVDGRLKDEKFHVTFKARKGEVIGEAYANPVDGIYLGAGPGKPKISPLVTSGMDGTLLDAEAVDPDTGAVLPVTEMGIERDGFRGDAVVLNVTMGTEEAGWSGIYLTRVPDGDHKSDRVAADDSGGGGALGLLAVFALGVPLLRRRLARRSMQTEA